MSGHLEVICGPMYAGKSEELLRRVRRVEIAGQSFAVFKPKIDNRYGQNKVVSHIGNNREAYEIKDWEEMYDIFDEIKQPQVIVIDEIQFFDFEMTEAIQRLITQCRVIVSGLDLDFRKQPFGIVPDLLAISKFVVKLRAVCQVCGEDAMYTQRLINGKPASLDGETIIVGGAEQYEARCENCWEAG